MKVIGTPFQVWAIRSEGSLTGNVVAARISIEDGRSLRAESNLGS
jgi:hypothetical protein